MSVSNEGPARTTLMSGRQALLVFFGGAFGTALRLLVGGLADRDLGLIIVNVTGAFLLAVMVGLFTKSKHPERRDVHLFMGVGMLGAFRTYSALAVQATTIPGLWWALATVAAGSVAAGAGFVIGSRTRPRGRAS